MNFDFVKSLILRICKQPRSFEYISKNLNGLDPLKAKEALDLLVSENKLTKSNGMWVIKKPQQNANLSLFPYDSHLYLKKYMGYFDFLKTPHPLDFEWRNSTASLLHLVNKLQQLCLIKDSILILGMPTLFATASIKDIPQRVTLIERNKPILQGLRKIVGYPDRFKIVDADIFHMKPSLLEKHYCVIMDPPWYTEHFFQFIWLASQCVEIGGLVAISIPPINTRPEIPNERIEWITFCHQIGLCIESIEPQLLEYAMPFFEFNAIRSAGITDILPFWRKGDFLVFRKVRYNEVERPVFIPTKEEWKEREIDSIRIRVRLQESRAYYTEENITIKSIIKGDILPTVSRRDKIREKANVWTSGNRIFETNDPLRFLNSLDEISKGAHRNDENKTVYDFVETITKLESKEYSDYLEWLYYEMERQAT